MSYTSPIIGLAWNIQNVFLNWTHMGRFMITV